MPQQQLTERGRLLEATSTTDSGAVRRPIQIITPGWGSSGYYSAEVLEAAARDKVIPAGTLMYLNHASESERHDRPERDVEKIAAALVEDARWDGSRLIAEAELLGPNGELIGAIAPYIGVSISGSATDVIVGEAEGRTGPIIEGLAHVASVDFVTHAGRGGMVLLESARPSLVNARATAHGVDEATVNDTREALQTLLRDTYGGGDRTYVWVRDFDDTTVWFEIDSESDAGMYGQSYSSSDAGGVALTGERAEVRVVTTYVPVNPAGRTTTQESEEDTMPQIEESRLAQLEEAAGRVTTLESERDAAVAERDDARTQLAERDRTDRARAIVAERATHAEITFTALEERGLMAGLPFGDDGSLDEAAFTTRVDEAAATVAQERGAGRVTGFGGTPTGQPTVSEADIDGAVAGVFGRQVKEA